ncbi:MAG: type IX secretion system membrane protein PorP/SprF [Flavobacteriaceae bacterium]|nr:type IX secretion system membrane protein PorP/SprF [Flavobacteriaceae bacterium]
MICRKLISILILFLCLPSLGLAQQLPQFTQYMYNTISINPAYAGSREIMVVNALNRNQWAGINGAPVTQTLSAHTSIPNTKFGVGLSFISDKLGFEKTTYAYADVSYTIRLNQYDAYKLAFGLKFGASKYDLDQDLLNDGTNASDPFLDLVNFKWSPNIGAGIYFRGESFYLGLSSPKLINYKEDNIEYVSLDRVSYFFNGGYLLDVNKNLKFKPTFLLKYTEGAPVSMDLSTLFFINEKLWLGGSYRFFDSFGAIINFKIFDGLSMGYAYDYITTDLNSYSSGSHEFMLNYEFVFPKPKCKCKDLY